MPGSDTADFVYWEFAGMVHASYDSLSTVAATLARDEGSVGGVPLPASALELPVQESHDNYGQEGGGGPCPMQLFPSRYPMRAAMVALDHWVRDGKRPASAPRYERAENGALVVDPETGNVKGGIRLPPVVAPVATYTSECGLFGSTVPYDALKLSALYPTHQDYVTKFRDAADDAVANGWLRRVDAAELVSAAEASGIGESLATG